MKKTVKRIFALLLASGIALGLCTAALASSPSPVDPSDTLEVSIKTADGTTLLHTYTLAEMNALADGLDVSYSDIDNMPWTVKTVASGVYLEDLINDVQRYAALDLWNFSKLRFTATDGAVGNFTYSDIFADRYYFPGLHETGHGLNEYGEINYDVGAGVKVKPMLSITASQERLPLPSQDARSYSPERYTVLFGMTQSELENVTPRLSDCKRGVCRLVIDMGNVSLPSGDVPVESVHLNLTSSTLQEGRTLQLTAEVTPSNATVSTVTWSSGNMHVASVTSNGLVTALSPGTAVIRATSDSDRKIFAECTIEVTEPEVNVTLSRDKLSLPVGEKALLTAAVTGSEGPVTWVSSDEAIATVEDGLVTAVGVGDAVVYAECGSAGDECAVHVTADNVKVESVMLDRSGVQLVKGESLQLLATCLPEDATNTDVYWSSNAPGVASVSTEGVVTAKNIGTSLITVVTDDGGYKAFCTVTVTDERTDYYSDISENWAGEEINAMSALGFVTGYADGTYRPNENITRTQFVTILVRILQTTRGVSLQTGHTFADTKGTWAEIYVSTAVALGITNGYGDGSFGYSDKVTREQMAAMLARAAAIPSGTDVTTGFSDSAGTSSWAVSAVAQMAGLGIITGYSDGSFRPANNATRAQAAALLDRFYEHEVGGA